MAVDVVGSYAEETLVVSTVACGRIGELLPGVVLYLQHHGFHVISKRGEVLVGSEVSVAQSCNLFLECSASLVIEEIVESGL